MTARSTLFVGSALIVLLLTAAGARAELALFGSYYDNVARAAAANDALKVRQLLGDHSANQEDGEGRTGLQIAATNGNLQIAAILIKAGANIDTKDKLGNTALHLAIDRNQVEMAQLLIDVGAALDVDNRNGMTPLMVAASRGNAAIVQALLAKGANARKTDFTGRDALSELTTEPTNVRLERRPRADKRGGSPRRLRRRTTEASGSTRA